MRIDPSSFYLMGLVVVALALLYAAAMYAKSRKRRIEHDLLEAALQARAAESTNPEEPSAVANPARPAAIRPETPAAPPPPKKPAAPPLHPKALIAWSPPVNNGQPHFNRYITWPGTKVTTPVAERAASDKDYVWD